MLNTSASKSAGQEEKRNGPIRRQPLREHELLGLPKSTGKKDGLNGTTIERPRLQPVRIKDLFPSSDCKKSKKPAPDRRMTTLPSGTNHFRRKLYGTSKDQASPGNTSTIAFNGRKTSDSLYTQGLSKSDGKIKKFGGFNRERAEPENMRDFLKSWEKIQTVPHSIHAPKGEQVRSQSVRRKLYSVSHSSPIATSRNDRKHEIVADKKPNPQKTCIVDGKTMKQDSRKSITAESTTNPRRSRIPPPNAIRDRYVNVMLNETIKEESSLMSTTLESEARTMDFAKNSKKNEVANGLEDAKKLSFDEVSASSENVDEYRATKMQKMRSMETNESKNSLLLENVSNDTQKCEENDAQDQRSKTNKEMTRPTVIMGVSAKSIRKERLIDEFEDREVTNVPDSCMPHQEFHDNTPKRRGKLDDVSNTSLEDLFGNGLSRPDRGDSIYHENLPRDSFLHSVTNANRSMINVDQQTLLWMHGNLKLNIQSSEEQLFSMRLLLKTLEKVMKDQEEVAVPQDECKTGSDAVTPPMTIAPLETKDQQRPVEESHEPLSEGLGDDKNKELTTERTPGNIHSREHIERSATIDQQDSILENNDDRDKENCEASAEKPRRRSARLKQIANSPKRSDDSFSLTEIELNIVHSKAAKKKDTPSIGKSAKRIDPRCRRSVREYMALKSSINFLATPDVNGVLPTAGEKETPSYVRGTRRSLSRKLLTELDDLYGDSPI